MRNVFFLSFLFVFVGGCATRLPPPSAALEQRWQQQRQALQALDVWRAHGRIGVRTEDDGWTASFDWRQRGEQFRIQLSGPFGHGVLALSGDNQAVALQQADRAPRVARSAEALLAEETGWRLPVSGLRYWLLGLPRPQTSQRHRLDASGQLAELRQDGWRIQYRRYQQVGGYRLPTRLSLSHADLNAKLVIDQWQPATTP